MRCRRCICRGRPLCLPGISRPLCLPGISRPLCLPGISRPLCLPGIWFFRPPLKAPLVMVFNENRFRLIPYYAVLTLSRPSLIRLAPDPFSLLTCSRGVFIRHPDPFRPNPRRYPRAGQMDLLEPGRRYQLRKRVGHVSTNVDGTGQLSNTITSPAIGLVIAGKATNVVIARIYL
jgi:hypothetical protein